MKKKKEKKSITNIQSNFNSSNTDGSFTMVDSNSFLIPCEILPIAQENKYLGFLGGLFFIYHELVCWLYSLKSPFMKLYVMCTDKNCLIEVI